MNKHVLTFTEKLNETIGRGSVLLVKGKPMTDGRYLYVTTINGWVEIKPGIKMVFVGDTVYRVIHKGGDKFSGRKVDIRGEEGLKGVFNMKNPGKPSLVLNHNKTPFHWMTLKHTDIGTALREIGARLFSHELILESGSSISKDEENKFLVKELIKKLAGQESAVIIKEVEVGDKYDIYDFDSDAQESESNFEARWDVYFKVILDDSKLTGPYADHFASTEIIESEWEVLDAMGLDPEIPDILLSFETNVEVSHSYDPGDYYTPPSGDTEVGDPETQLLISDINKEEYESLKSEMTELRAKLQELDKDSKEYNMINLKLRGLSSKYHSNHFPYMYEGSESVVLGKDPEIEELINIIEYIMDGETPEEIMSTFEGLAGMGSNSERVKFSVARQAKYLKRKMEIDRNGLSEEDKKKWTNFSPQYSSFIESEALKLIEEHLELESRDIPNSERPLTEQEIKRSEDIFDWLDQHIPSKIGSRFESFRYAKRRWVEQENNWKIFRMNDKMVKRAIDSLKTRTKNPDHFLKYLERQYNFLNYQKDTRREGHFPGNLQNQVKEVNIFLNPEYKI